MVKPKVGDVIFATRAAYNHYGIYSGRNKVVHYCKVDGSSCDGEICETSLDEFLDGDTLHICNFDRTGGGDIVISVIDALAGTMLSRVNPVASILGRMFTRRYRQEHRKNELHVFTPRTVVRRAKSKIGTRGYNLLWNNCEHFALWCKTGEPMSEQV